MIVVAFFLIFGPAVRAVNVLKMTKSTMCDLPTFGIVTN